MKEIVIWLSFSFALVLGVGALPGGCSSQAEPTITTITHDGHLFVTRYGAILHHPDCKCNSTTNQNNK